MKRAKVRPAVRAYRVLSPTVGRMLGPFPVRDQGDDRVVILTDTQAKYYLDNEVIVAAD